MEKHSLASILINLLGISITSAAKSAGLNTSAVAGWLKGIPGRLSQEKQDELLEKLGVSRRNLSVDRIHYWILKTGDLTPLKEILEWTAKPYEMIYCLPNKVDWRYRFSDLIKFPLLIRSIDSFSPVRIVLVRKPSIFVPDSEIQEEDSILIDSGLARWSLYGEISVVNKPLFERFKNKEVSVQEYDQLWNSLETAPRKGGTKASSDKISNFSWKEFGREMDQRGISPEEALQRIEGWSGAKQKGIQPEGEQKIISENQGE